jgi:hypothetical protein
VLYFSDILNLTVIRILSFTSRKCRACFDELAKRSGLVKKSCDDHEWRSARNFGMCQKDKNGSRVGQIDLANCCYTVSAVYEMLRHV